MSESKEDEALRAAREALRETRSLGIPPDGSGRGSGACDFDGDEHDVAFSGESQPTKPDRSYAWACRRCGAYGWERLPAPPTPVEGLVSPAELAAFALLPARRAEGVSKVVEYRRARVACEIVRRVLDDYDFDRLLADIGHADAVGALVDPTLYREKHRAMLEDRAVFEAARAYVSTWPKS